MRAPAAALLVLLLAGVRGPASEEPLRPDPTLTPGAVLTTDAGAICQRGYARTVRHTSGRVKRDVYREYGLNPRGSRFEIDHLVPLELGGADVKENLWPESYETRPWNARVKDELENFLHAEVCAGRMPVQEAQREISRNWIAAYQKYLGEPLAERPTRRRRG